MRAGSNWVDTYGGPHLLLAEELLPYWHGAKDWRNHLDPLDDSDYARACRITGWLGVVPCGPSTALVLSGDVGRIAWFADAHRGGHLVQCIAANDEKDIETAIRSGEIANLLRSSTEVAEFSTGISGNMWLFDSALPGSDLESNCEVLELEPGRYRVLAEGLESKSFTVIIRHIKAIEFGLLSEDATKRRQTGRLKR